MIAQIIKINTDKISEDFANYLRKMVVIDLEYAKMLVERGVIEAKLIFDITDIEQNNTPCKIT